MGAKVERITPSWLKTVGEMIRADITLRARCRTCEVMFKVDLEAIAAVKGRHYSLIGGRAACKIVGCDGCVVFLYSPGKGTPFRPMPEE